LNINAIQTTKINKLCLQGDNWNELLKEVITFESVEEFWGVYVSCHVQARDRPCIY